MQFCFVETSKPIISINFSPDSISSRLPQQPLPPFLSLHLSAYIFFFQVQKPLLSRCACHDQCIFSFHKRHEFSRNFLLFGRMSHRHGAETLFPGKGQAETCANSNKFIPHHHHMPADASLVRSLTSLVVAFMQHCIAITLAVPEFLAAGTGSRLNARPYGDGSNLIPVPTSAWNQQKGWQHRDRIYHISTSS